MNVKCERVRGESRALKLAAGVWTVEEELCPAILEESGAESEPILAAGR